jgi:hypothetical protein
VVTGWANDAIGGADSDSISSAANPARPPRQAISVAVAVGVGSSVAVPVAVGSSVAVGVSAGTSVGVSVAVGVSFGVSAAWALGWL